MAAWHSPRLRWRRSPGAPSYVMICLRILARTGSADSRSSCASFPPSSGSTAMSIFCVTRWRSARGMIEWLCTQERRKSEVVIIFGTEARYRRATVDSSHDDAHPDNSTLHMGTVCPHTGFVESFYLISFRTGHVFTCSKCCQVFRVFRGRALVVRGMMYPYFPVGSLGFRGGEVGTGSMEWLYWNLMAHPILGEEHSTSSPRWL
jgi:hypothetical protein